MTTTAVASSDNCSDPVVCPAAVDDDELKAATVLLACFRFAHPRAPDIEAKLTEQVALQRRLIIAGNPSVSTLLSLEATALRSARIAVAKDVEIHALKIPSPLDCWTNSSGTCTEPGFSNEVLQFARGHQHLFVLVATSSPRGPQYHLYPSAIPQSRDAMKQVAYMLSDGVLELPPVPLAEMPCMRGTRMVSDVAFKTVDMKAFPITVMARAPRTVDEQERSGLMPRDLDMRCIQANAASACILSAPTARRLSSMAPSDVLRYILPAFKAKKTIDRLVLENTLSEFELSPYSRGYTCMWASRVVTEKILDAIRWEKCSRKDMIDTWTPSIAQPEAPFVVMHHAQVTRLLVQPGAMPLSAFACIGGIGEVEVFMGATSGSNDTSYPLRDYFVAESENISSLGHCSVTIHDEQLDDYMRANVSLANRTTPTPPVGVFLNATFLSSERGFPRLRASFGRARPKLYTPLARSSPPRDDQPGDTPEVSENNRRRRIERELYWIREDIAWYFLSLVHSRSAKFVIFAMPSEKEAVEVRELVGLFCSEIEKQAEKIEANIWGLPENTPEHEALLSELAQYAGGPCRPHIISIVTGDHRLMSYLVWIDGLLATHANVLLPRYFHCCTQSTCCTHGFGPCPADE